MFAISDLRTPLSVLLTMILVGRSAGKWRSDVDAQISSFNPSHWNICSLQPSFHTINPNSLSPNASWNPDGITFSGSETVRILSPPLFINTNNTLLTADWKDGMPVNSSFQPRTLPFGLDALALTLTPMNASSDLNLSSDLHLWESLIIWCISERRWSLVELSKISSSIPVCIQWISTEEGFNASEWDYDYSCRI